MLQVNRARLKDGRQAAVAVLRRRVEDEALASLGALSASSELEPVSEPASISRLYWTLTI